jgi:hypothetical protein
MLNSPIETGIDAGKEFEKNEIGRMDRAHEAHAEFNRALAELPEQEKESPRKRTKRLCRNPIERTIDREW